MSALYGMSDSAAGRYLRMRLCAMVSTEAQLSGPGTPVVLTFLCRGRISESPAYDVSRLDFSAHSLDCPLAEAPHAVKNVRLCVVVVIIIIN